MSKLRRLTCDFAVRQGRSQRSLTSLCRAVRLRLFIGRGNHSQCRSEPFNRTIAAAQKRMAFARAWRPRTAAWCLSAGAPRVASSSRRRITEPLVSSLNAPAKVREVLPKRRRLRARPEFQKVYAEGQRYDGRLMAAFLRVNESADHRLGVTASTKAIGKSVDRTRARRLLREVFRRSAAEINSLERKYDWVLNAKRPLLVTNEELRFREFRSIIEQVAREERQVENRGASQL